MSQAMDITHATKPSSLKAASFTRSTQPTIKQAYNIYEPLREDSSTEDDNKMDTTTEGDNNNNIDTNNTASISNQPTEDAANTQTNTSLPTVQLTHIFEALTTQTDMEIAMTD